MNLNSIFRPNILNLKAYSSARSLNTKGEIFLDANESALDPYFSETSGLENLKSYPKPQPEALLNNLAQIYQVKAENLLVGRGVDEAIDLLTRATCEPGQDSILITPPTYGMYKVSADIQNISTLSAPLIQEETSWKLDLKGIKEQLLNSKQKIKLLYLCSPNNPTGDLLSLEDIREVCKMTPDSTLVVIDEAYAEFSNQSAISLINEFSNAVVLRTLSKAWGLAGLRCGSLIANPEIIEVMQKVKAPYPLPQPVVELATQATSLDGKLEMQKRVEILNQEKQILKQELLKLSQVKKIYQSQANFLLVEFVSAMEAMEVALAKGIVLRNRDQEIKNCVRITIGTKEQNQYLLDTLKKGLS